MFAQSLDNITVLLGYDNKTLDTYIRFKYFTLGSKQCLGLKQELLLVAFDIPGLFSQNGQHQ